MKNIHQYLILGIIALCVIPGFSSAIPMDPNNPFDIMTISVLNPDPSGQPFSFTFTETEFSNSYYANRSIGRPAPIGYSVVPYLPSGTPSSQDNSNPIGFINVLLPNPFCGGPHLLDPSETPPVYWQFDLNGVSPQTNQGIIYNENDTACGDCGPV